MLSGLALQKKTLQKQKYLEAKELKSNLKRSTAELKLKEDKCSSDMHRLNTSMHMWQEKSEQLQVSMVQLYDGYPLEMVFTQR